jgi:hypothetical protein
MMAWSRVTSNNGRPSMFFWAEIKRVVVVVVGVVCVCVCACVRVCVRAQRGG